MTDTHLVNDCPISLDRHVAAITSLVTARVPTDVTQLLVEGDASRGVAPLALANAIHAADKAMPKFPEGRWQWWAGPNDEYYTSGPFESRDDAVAIATKEGIGLSVDGYGQKFYIVEAKQDPISFGSHVDIDQIFEIAEDNIRDSNEVGEDDDTVFDVSAEEQADLGRRIKLACIEWQLFHKRQFRTSVFTETRNHEIILLEAPAADDTAEAPDAT